MPVRGDRLAGVSSPTVPDVLREQWRVLAAASVLFVLTGGPSAFLMQRFTASGPDFEQWPYQYPFTLAGLAGAALLGSSWPRLSTRMERVAVGSLSAFVVWSLWSVQWSVLPAITSPRALTSVGVMAFAIWFGTALDRAEQRRSVALALAVFLVISVVLVAVVPSYGRGVFRVPSGGRFRGLSPNPNSLGPLCVLAAITFVALLIESRRLVERVVAGGFTVLAVGLLIGSGSDTALAVAGVAVAVAVAVWGASRLQRRGVDGRIVAGATVAVVVVVAVAVRQWFWKLSELLSGDPTFDNRRNIWTQMLAVADMRPWRGWGYWAYWNVTNSGAVLRYGSAHNSLIEVYLGLGLVGAVLFVVIVALALVGVCRLVWCSFDTGNGWLAVVAVALVIGHATESFVLWFSLNWALVCSMAVGSWTIRHRTRPGAPV